MESSPVWAQLWSLVPVVGNFDIHAWIRWFLTSKIITEIVIATERVLKSVGVKPPYPDEEHVGICIAATAATLFSYYVFFGNRHQRRRKRLQAELRAAQERVQLLEEKLVEAEVLGDDATSGRQVRIWMDGAFDMMHYGHMNAFRQGRALGTYLVVGVNSDKSITECKGPPVMNDAERLMAVEGCKFVDEVVTDVPYVMDAEYIAHIMDKYNIDFVVHGDDPCIVNGRDVYETAKAMGKYRSIPRTEGVSTTDIVGRMLLRSREHHSTRLGDDKSALPRLASGKGSAIGKDQGSAQIAVRSQFLTTSRMLRLFSAGVKAPPKGARVVYIDGAWDMFHAGHVAILKEARAFGDYLIAGVHGDDTVNARRGLNMPIMNLNERVLSVLGCAYVDDVLIDAPADVTREMVASLSICAVIQGTVNDNDWGDGGGGDGASTGSESASDEGDEGDAGGSGEEVALRRRRRKQVRDEYAVAKALNMYHRIGSPSCLTVKEIMGRIQKNQEAFEKKFAKKKKAEDEYYKGRYNMNAPPASAP
ncbi:CTP-phosphoethanolamine cytidylyltransferase [Tribonema minus]|uniref:ethanolamine-phosphate cytidylyltransferase n=1 Tax=Tribonema minus TaxID=303371 RepID=A0A836CFT5_9STRA|nr:CTP-phosphoethanolamine cytidylyltransferase [Tribonema minus]